MEGKSAMLYKTLVVGVIVLFIGTGVQPAIATVEPTTIESDDCSLCPKVSNQQIDKLKNSIDRIKQIKNELSLIAKYYPEIEEKCKDLSDKITNIMKIKDKYIFSNFWPFPLLTAFCTVALSLWIAYFNILDYFIYEVLNKLYPYIGLQGWMMGLMLVEMILAPMFLILFPTLFICGFWEPGPP